MIPSDVANLERQVRELKNKMQEIPIPGCREILIEDSPVIKFKQLRLEAVIPTKGTEEAAGWDLRSNESVDFYRNDQKMVSTGIAVAIPKGYVGLLCSRSGMVAKTGVHVANQPGIIDSDYRGEVKVILQTEAWGDDHDIHLRINKGDRIAQLVIVPCPLFKAVEVEDLDATDRGEGGFGSTGVK